MKACPDVRRLSVRQRETLAAAAGVNPVDRRREWTCAELAVHAGIPFSTVAQALARLRMLRLACSRPAGVKDGRGTGSVMLWRVVDMDEMKRLGFPGLAEMVAGEA